MTDEITNKSSTLEIDFEREIDFIVKWMCIFPEYQLGRLQCAPKSETLLLLLCFIVKFLSVLLQLSIWTWEIALFPNLIIYQFKISWCFIYLYNTHNVQAGNFHRNSFLLYANYMMRNNEIVNDDLLKKKRWNTKTIPLNRKTQET